MLITDADRPAAFRLLGVQPAAEWCWSNSDIAEALTHGVEVNGGLRIMRPKHAELRADRIVFTGGWYGEHSLSIDNSDADRVLAHWSGYVEAV